jgi:hypothetical protein
MLREQMRTAAIIALVATAALLAGYGALAGRRGGLRAVGIGLCALSGAVIGLLRMFAKALLHYQRVRSGLVIEDLLLLARPHHAERTAA